MFWNLEVTVPSLNIESLLQGKQKRMIRMGTFGPYRLKNFSEWRWGRHFLQRPQHNAIVPMFLVVFIARAAFVCELLRFLAHFKPHLLMFPYVPLRIRPIAIEAEIWVCLSLSLSESLSLRVSLSLSLSLRLSVCPSICLSICVSLSVFLSVCLCICLCLCLCLSAIQLKFSCVRPLPGNIVESRVPTGFGKPTYVTCVRAFKSSLTAVCIRLLN